MTSSRARTREVNRRTVVTVAGQLFEERGFYATTVRDIAQKAGVSVGTVMAAGDKEALLVELFDELIEERQQLVDTQPPTNVSDCAAAAVAAVEPFVDLFEQRRSLAQTYASILVSGRHSSVVFSDLAQRLIVVFEQLLAVSGGLRPQEATCQARALYASYIGSLFMWAATPERTAAEFLAQLYDIFVAICSDQGDR